MNYSEEHIEMKVDLIVKWKRIKIIDGELFKFGDNIDNRGSRLTKRYPDWKKSKIIYRWVKNSTKEVAYVGESERTIHERVKSYHGANETTRTNLKVFKENERLKKNNDCLYLEYADHVPGYDLDDNRERKRVEKLLIVYYDPYLNV